MGAVRLGEGLAAWSSRPGLMRRARAIHGPLESLPLPPRDAQARTPVDRNPLNPLQFRSCLPYGWQAACENTTKKNYRNHS